MKFNIFWKNKNFKRWLCTAIPIFALLLTIVLVLSNNMFFYQTLNEMFGGEKQVLKSGDASKYIYYKGDYDNKKDVLSSANDLNAKIVEEGIVLLKNENDALPMDKNQKVTIFGKNSENMVLGGSGSNASSSGGNSVKTIFQSLEAVGFTVNPEMREFYQNNSRSGNGRPQAPDMNSTITGLTGFPIGETPKTSYDETVKNSWKQYNDVAIVVVSRIGGEGFDLPRSMFWDGKNYQNWESNQLIPGARNKDDHYLQLDQNETDMIKTASENFNKVIVLVNSPTLLEMGFLDDPTHYAYCENVTSALWIGTSGNSGIMALGKILVGETSPSGRTVDISARNYKKGPTWNNFGNNLVQNGNRYVDESGNLKNAYFLNYSEGIYTGYRYYETRAFEENKKGNSSWYADNVVYPFGYGLSYSQFAWNVASHSEQEISANDIIQIEVEIENISEYTGKDVLQLYYSAPYTSGEIEKSQVVLGAFKKTDSLASGETKNYVLELNVRDMASYDYNDANKNGFSGYELEAGDYTIYVAKNSHDFSMPLTFTVNSDIKYEKDSETNNDIDNLFDDVSGKITKYTSRVDFEKTFPSKPTSSDYTLSASDIKKLNYKLNDKETDAWYSEIAPTQSQSVLSYNDTQVKLWRLIGKDYNDPLWDELLNQLTVSQMSGLIESGNYHTQAIENIDKPQTTDPDGPMGYSLFMGNPSVYDTCYYASESLMGATWNIDLMQAFGEMIGNESLVGNLRGDGRTYAGWYAPAVNLHRSPFGGRNFEYYSEDPVLSGNMAVSVIKGAMSKGVYTYLKHFALNEQETNRDTNGLVVWANEQSMREMYFVPFERAVKDAKTTAMMSSFTRIGFTWAGGNYSLLTSLLREEWGFEGMVITDYNLMPYMNLDQMIRAGGDLNLSQSKALSSYNTSTSISMIRRATKNILFTIANSNAMNGRGDGNIYGMMAPTWFIMMWTAFAVIVAGIAVWGFFVIRKIAVVYNMGVKNGIIIPEPKVKKIKVKDPNYKFSPISSIYLISVGLLMVAVMTLSCIFMSLPDSFGAVAEQPDSYIKNIELTYNYKFIEGSYVELPIDELNNKITVMVDTFNKDTQGIKFISSDENVAKIDESTGVLTPVAKGEAIITVSVVADPSVKAQTVVRVVAEEEENAEYSVTVVGCSASVEKTNEGELVTITPATLEGKEFVKWEFNVDNVTVYDNHFIMPNANVTVTAIFKNKTYTVKLADAKFADGSTEKKFEYKQKFPTDCVNADNEIITKWKDADGKYYFGAFEMVAKDVVLSAQTRVPTTKLVMATTGYDYGSGTTNNEAIDGLIDGENAKTIMIDSGKSTVRIKSGGIVGNGDNAITAVITIKNDNAFDVTFDYLVEYYGTEWKVENITLSSGAVTNITLNITGLASGANPYHQIRFNTATTNQTSLSFYGYLWE